MRIIEGTTEFNIEESTAVAIGKFDGIHIGHRQLLKEIIECKKDGYLACVFTFDPSPNVFFGGEKECTITTKEEKRKIFEKIGVDILVEFPLNKQTAATTPEAFVRDILVAKMHAGFVVAGTDVSFGAGGRGNAQLLIGMGKQLGFEVKTIDKVCMDGVEVSSTYIRSLLEQGKMETAIRCLGGDYSFVGKVLHGNRIGRTLGFPTVNIEPDSRKILPPFGVYFSRVTYKGETYFAISNIGNKPTVTEEKKCGIESFLYDFAQDIYDEEIEVSLYGFRRPEKRFDGLEQLKEQLREDIAAGKNYWKLIEI